MARVRDGECSAHWAAEHLSMNIQTIWRWCREGKIAFRRNAVGRYFLVRAEIEAIAAGSSPSTNDFA